MEERNTHVNAAGPSSGTGGQASEAAGRQTPWPQMPDLSGIASREELTLAATAGAAIAFGLLILKRLLQAR